MKKKLFVLFTFAAFLALVVFACKKEEDGLQVGFASENTSGHNPDNTTVGTTSTSVGSTTSTSGATTSSTSGSTTSTPTGNYFKLNSTVYNCTVSSTAPSGEYNIIGRSSAGDTCMISFTSIPASGTYPHTGGFFPSAGESLVAIQIGSAATGVYMGVTGNVVVTIPSGTSRKASITNMMMVNLSNSTTATLNASLTAP